MSAVPAHDVDTPVGPARVHVHAAAGSQLTVVLGHGAGGGVDARDLVALDRALPPLGVTVVRVESPWRVAGKRVASPPPTLDVAWRAVLSALPGLGVPGRYVTGGRSAGARVAARTALDLGAAGALALAFPLHPPGRPDRTRLPELADAGVPVLVVQGERDPFGGPSAFPTGTSSLPGVELVAVPYADHGFRVPAAAPLTQREALGVLTDAVSHWLTHGLRRLTRSGVGV